MSSGWLNYWQYLIRMTYEHFSMSSEWHIIPPYVIRMTSPKLVSHPDELRQCYYVIRITYASILKSSGWDSKFRFPQYVVAFHRFRRWPHWSRTIISFPQGRVSAFDSSWNPPKFLLHGIYLSNYISSISDGLLSFIPHNLTSSPGDAITVGDITTTNWLSQNPSTSTHWSQGHQKWHFLDLEFLPLSYTKGQTVEPG